MPRLDQSSHCPYCGYELDGATSPRDQSMMPSPGDVSICIECGGICLFTADLRLRKPTLEEDSTIRAELGATLAAFELARRAAHRAIKNQKP